MPDYLQDEKVTHQLGHGVSVTFLTRHRLTYYYNAIFRDRSGATIEMQADDRSTDDSPHITLTLRDAQETIHSGTNRYIDAERAGAPTLSIRRRYFGLFGNVSLHCTRGDQSETVVVSPALAEDVTRERIQHFAHHHPELAAAVRGITLPVGTTGGYYVPWATLLDTPARARACAAGRPLVERAGH